MRKPGERMVTVGFVVDTTTRDQLKRIARDEDRRVSGVVRDMVLEALQRLAQREASAEHTADNAVA